MLDATRARRSSTAQLALADACLSLLAGLALISLGAYALFIMAGIAW